MGRGFPCIPAPGHYTLLNLKSVSGTMTNQPVLYQQHPQAAPTNGLAIAGFIVAIAGLVMGMFFCPMTLLCPVGMVLSLIALARPPRGFAIAGVAVGAIGTIIPALLFFFFGAAILSMFSCLTMAAAAGVPAVRTQAAFSRAENDIKEFELNHQNAIPTDLEGGPIIGRQQDGWRRPLRYTKRSDTSYELRSAGPDGVFENADDIVRNFTQGVP